MTRCPWLPLQHPLYVEYHDKEWGVPSRDARYLFECICLEGAQAGLSWWTVLQKREQYRKVFHHFEPAKVARMTDRQLEQLLLDPSIIRHRGKILSVRQNARAWMALDNPVEWIWGFVGGQPIVNRFRTMGDFPSRTAESDALSKALKKAGFNFVGSTTMYAFMQAVGMFNDHTTDCFRRSRAV
jgi:DNA-3-methyladenine glycosylase I